MLEDLPIVDLTVLGTVVVILRYYWFHNEEEEASLLQMIKTSRGMMFRLVIAILLLVPVHEEVIFRSWLVDILEMTGMGSNMIQILTSVMFGLYHLTEVYRNNKNIAMFQVSYTTVVGFLLYGLSLNQRILLHCYYNTFIVIINLCLILHKRPRSKTPTKPLTFETICVRNRRASMIDMTSSSIPAPSMRIIRNREAIRLYYEMTVT